jgi:hypothetical protein
LRLAVRFANQGPEIAHFDGNEADLAALRKLTVDLLTRANETRRRGGEI